MTSRAMVVVAAGASDRFGGDKLFEEVAGRPLVWHAVASVRGSVEVCVLVGRTERLDELRRLDLDAVIVAGGATRTLSEMAGLAAVGEPPGLIGIHDGARPLVTRALVERLFETADEIGGAVPLLKPGSPLVDKANLRPVSGLMTAQTPQVFRGPELIAAYAEAARSGFEGRDTAEVMERFSQIPVAAVPGEPGNIKVTYPEDMEQVRLRITTSSRNEPR